MTPTDAPRDVKILLTGWSMLAAASVILLLRYGDLPELVPVYQPPWADAPTLGAKTPFTVARLATMGLGQVGAATVMAISSWRANAWRRLWTWAVVVAGAKTLLECVGLSSDFDRGALVLTAILVAAFAAAVVTWWRRGELANAPTIGPRGLVGVATFLALWAVSAALPVLG